MCITFDVPADLRDRFRHTPGQHLVLRAEVGGEEMDGAVPVKATYDSPRAYCLLAKQELGLSPYPVDETIRATGDSLNR